MLEASCAVDLSENEAICYYEPRYSSVYIPDSQEYWDIVWENKDNIAGIAHSHPGNGIPNPSFNLDIKSFSSLDIGFGRKLKYWIISSTDVVVVQWVGPELYDFKIELETRNLLWIQKLREISHYHNNEEIPVTIPSE